MQVLVMEWVEGVRLRTAGAAKRPTSHLDSDVEDEEVFEDEEAAAAAKLSSQNDLALVEVRAFCGPYMRRASLVSACPFNFLFILHASSSASARDAAQGRCMHMLACVLSWYCIGTAWHVPDPCMAACRWVFAAAWSRC